MGATTITQRLGLVRRVGRIIDALDARGAPVPDDIRAGWERAADSFAAQRGAGRPGRRAKEVERVNAYQGTLEDIYAGWADDLASDLAKAAPDERETVIADATLVLLGMMQAEGRRALPEAVALGLDGDPYPPDLLDDLAAAVRENERYLETSLIPDVERKLRAGLNDQDVLASIAAGAGSVALAGLLQTFVGRVASYAGAWWALFNRAVGRAADQGGKRVRWVKDHTISNHCEECGYYGDRTYDSFQAMLDETGCAPAYNVSCGGNCRCRLEYVDDRDRQFASDGLSADIFHRGPGPHPSGSPQKIHSFRYGVGFSKLRDMRRSYDDELWNEYKNRARTRAGAAGKGGGATKGDDKPTDPRLSTAEQARKAIIARTGEKLAELDQIDKDIEAKTKQVSEKYKEVQNLKYGTEEYAAAHEEATKQYAEVKALRDKKNALEAEISGIRHPELEAVNPAQVNIQVAGGKLDRTRRNAVETGVESFSRMVDASVVGADGATLGVDRASRRAKGRSYQSGNAIYMSTTAGPSVVVHEMGHWVEGNRPDILARSIAFRGSRTQGEGVVSLARVYPGSGYGYSEVTLRDRFESAYSGKVYRRGGSDYASEILSMGFQYMHENPAKFARNDPEYFDFVYNVAKGK